ncbi:MAG: CopG family transcriptional regulator [Candidatus Hodarchaeota archaeon]
MSDKERKFVSIKIPAQLYERIKKRLNETDFSSVSDYVAYVLREVLASLEEDYEVFTEEEEKKVKERLRSLGYLD